MPRVERVQATELRDIVTVWRGRASCVQRKGSHGCLPRRLSRTETSGYLRSVKNAISAFTLPFCCNVLNPSSVRVLIVISLFCVCRLEWEDEKVR